MRRAIAAAAVAALLAGPVAIAFFSGGFYDQPRLIAGIAACLLVLAAALAAERPLPRAWPGRVAVAALAALALWTAASLLWAPLGEAAIDDVQRLVLFAAVLVAAAAWLRPSWAASAVAPAVAFGALVVVGYGLAERMLPGLIELDASAAADGRLEQPITYWNATGAIAALGLVLCVSLAGATARPPWLRAAALAACPALAAGLYLTLSRGALAAAAAGLLVLLALVPHRPQALSAAVAASAGGLAFALAALLPEVGRADPGPGAGRQGAALLAGVVVLAVAGAAAQAALAAREGAGAQAAAPAASRLRAAAAALALLVAVVAVVAVGASRDASRRGSDDPGAARVGALGSNRYDYWSVAAGSFAAQPLTGVGTGGFRVEWLRERQVRERVRDAHSLYVETAAELGLVGIGLLAAFMAAVAAAARRAFAVDPAIAAGPIAAVAAFGFHAGLDWDWELPAVTLPALVLAGVLIALGDRAGGRRPRPAPTPPGS